MKIFFSWVWPPVQSFGFIEPLNLISNTTNLVKACKELKQKKRYGFIFSVDLYDQFGGREPLLDKKHKKLWKRLELGYPMGELL